MGGSACHKTSNNTCEAIAGVTKKQKVVTKSMPVHLLRETLRSRGLSDGAVAKCIGVNRSLVTRALDGQRPLDLDKLQSLPTPVLLEFLDAWKVARSTDAATRGVGDEFASLAAAFGAVAACMSDHVALPEKIRQLRSVAERLERAALKGAKLCW